MERYIIERLYQRVNEYRNQLMQEQVDEMANQVNPNAGRQGASAPQGGGLLSAFSGGSRPSIGPKVVSFEHHPHEDLVLDVMELSMLDHMYMMGDQVDRVKINELAASVSRYVDSCFGLTGYDRAVFLESICVHAPRNADGYFMNTNPFFKKVSNENRLLGVVEEVALSAYHMGFQDFGADMTSEAYERMVNKKGVSHQGITELLRLSSAMSGE